MDKLPVFELSQDQIHREMEALAWSRLQMPAAKVVRAYHEGRLEDPGSVADLLALAHLLPADDPLFVPA